jgi:hypothetical protein
VQKLKQREKKAAAEAHGGLMRHTEPFEWRQEQSKRIYGGEEDGKQRTHVAVMLLCID